MAKVKERDQFGDQEWLDFVGAGGSLPRALADAKKIDSWVYVRFYGLVPVSEDKRSELFDFLMGNSRAGIPCCIKRSGSNSIECSASFLATPESVELVSLGYGIILSK
ncbi:MULTISPECIES: hypothetical protein [Aeromonas]|uniref:Uncharacterized protein n=1 Tax=Aeromonas veronii TaxID=654 RepID=A0A4S5CGJ8_AERVE|nr:MULTISPECIES: hypothetical protein [Aeromonas]THJ44957.1 hypothetical protein E8Q35_12265 [Aeromonas veronii]